MKWEEIRKTYPDKFVKLKILDYHMEDNKKYIDDMAVIDVIEDNRQATKELVKSDKDTIVYHTANEEIVVEIKTVRGYRSII